MGRSRLHSSAVMRRKPSSSVFVANCRDLFLGCLVLIDTIHPFQMIIKRCAEQLNDRKKFSRIFDAVLNYRRFGALASPVFQNQSLQIFQVVLFRSQLLCFSQQIFFRFLQHKKAPHLYIVYHAVQQMGCCSSFYLQTGSSCHFPQILRVASCLWLPLQSGYKTVTKPERTESP